MSCLISGTSFAMSVLSSGLGGSGSSHGTAAVVACSGCGLSPAPGAVSFIGEFCGLREVATGREGWGVLVSCRELVSVVPVKKHGFRGQLRLSHRRGLRLSRGCGFR